MQSIVSLMSVNNNSDIAPLDDLEDIPDLESSGDISEHVLDFTAQLEQLTNSLTGSELATPMSGKCASNPRILSTFFEIVNSRFSSIADRRSNAIGRKPILPRVRTR